MSRQAAALQLQPAALTAVPTFVTCKSVQALDGRCSLCGYYSPCQKEVPPGWQARAPPEPGAVSGRKAPYRHWGKSHNNSVLLRHCRHQKGIPMFSFFSSATPFSPSVTQAGIGSIRIITGLLLIYHGLEIFDKTLMDEYAQWETFQGPVASLLVYAGKGAELLAGLLFLLGLLTRLAAILAIGTFLYITFFVGGGRFWYQDQHPFLFVLLAALFFFAGPGSWNLDRLTTSRKH